MTKVSLIRCSLLFIAFTYAVNHLQASADSSSIFDLLVREDFIELDIELDYKYLLRNKRQKEYKPGKLSFTDLQGNKQSWEVEIRTRGNMRLNVCEIPPLKVRFSNKDLKERGLKNFNTFKMVLICYNSKTYEQFLLKEYMIYRLYNTLTEESFRVQLAKVKYNDSSGGSAPMESFAILLEDDEELASRLGSKNIESKIASSRILNTDYTERMTVFQFMIGNTDWQVYNSHNLAIIAKTGSIYPITVPYDFDYSGLVSTPYAVPNDQVPIRHVTERYYQGFCRTEEDTKRTIQLFLDKKEELLAFPEQFPHFTPMTKKSVIRYLQSFFSIIEDPKRWKREILQKCNQWLKPLGD